MLAAHRVYTHDDLADTPDDGNRYEIIGGELFVSPAPRLAHQEVIGRLNASLVIYVTARQLGIVYGAPVDVRLSPYNTVRPDIVFIAQDRLDIRRRQYVAGAPDLVVEVLSDRTRGIDLVQKRALYAMAGVPEYWIVDIDGRSVTGLRLVDGQYVEREQGAGLASSAVVLGFAVAVDDLFTLV